MVDHIRTADANNPKGYYEFERVKQLPKGDAAWLRSARGKAVKIISALLEFLPENYEYRVIFMERDIDEILASQARMLVRTGKEQAHPISDDEIRQSYRAHLEQTSGFLKQQGWLRPLYVNYNDILRQPLAEFQRVADFLDGVVDPENMVQVVDRSLYREKR